MAPTFNLETWIREQYYQVGVLNGKFIGKDAFKRKLFPHHPSRIEEIRQVVNKIVSQGIPPTVPRPSKNPAVSSPVVSRTATGVQSPRTVSQEKAKAAVPQPSKKSAVSSSVVSQATKGAKTSRTVSQKKAKAAVVKIPAFSSQARPNSDFKMARSEPTQGVFVKQKAAAVEPEDGGVILRSLSEHSATEQTAPNPKVLELQAFVEASTNRDDYVPSETAGNHLSILDYQLKLLDLHDNIDNLNKGQLDIKNAILFPADMLEHCDRSLLPQYGLLGSSLPREMTYSTRVADPRLFLNTNIPFSAFICGLQGSGKSHTTSCMIENCLIRSPILGVLQKPLSALVFHFGECTSRLNFKPSEAAFLAFPSPEFSNHPRVISVNVLVSPSNYLFLSPLYKQIPGVSVQPFKLRPRDLGIGTMLTLMSVDQTQAAPLYMSQVTKVLREIASESSGSFNYPDFRGRLDEVDLDRKQRAFLNQRLDLLESFLDLEDSTASPAFEAGGVTIIDLSCPFVDANLACVLFKIGMDMYLESGSATGKVIVVDEAHKYMTDTPASKDLTESLLRVIRQQRHYGARVIISTQEPTISPRLIDLCSITAIHRFSSPEWFDVLRRHIFILDEERSNSDGKAELFKRIRNLKTGEALVFAPSAIVRKEEGDEEWGKVSEGVLKVKVRKRLTWDGGRSAVCI